MNLNDFLKKSPHINVKHVDPEANTSLSFRSKHEFASEILSSSRAQNLALAYQFIDTSFDDSALISDPIALVDYVASSVDPTPNHLMSAWVLDQYEHKKIKQEDLDQIRSLLCMFKSTGLKPTEIYEFSGVNDLYQFLQVQHTELFRNNKESSKHLADVGAKMLHVAEVDSAQLVALVSNEDAEAAIGSPAADKAIVGRKSQDFSQAIYVKALDASGYIYQEEFPHSISKLDGTEQEFKKIPSDAQRLFYYAWACAGMQKPLQTHFKIDVATARASLPKIRNQMMDISPDSKSFAAQELYFKLSDPRMPPERELGARAWNLRQLNGLVQNETYGSKFFTPICDQLTEYFDAESIDFDKLEDRKKLILDPLSEDLLQNYPHEVLAKVAMARATLQSPLTHRESQQISDIVIAADSAGEVLDALSLSQMSSVAPHLIKDLNSAKFLSFMQVSSALCQMPNAIELHKEFFVTVDNILSSFAENSPEANYFSKSLLHLSNLLAKGQAPQSFVEKLIAPRDLIQSPDVRSGLIRSPLLSAEQRSSLIEKESSPDVLIHASSRLTDKPTKDLCTERLAQLYSDQNLVKTELKALCATNKNPYENNFSSMLTNQVDKNLEFNHRQEINLFTLTSGEVLELIDKIEEERPSGIKNDNTN